MVTGLPTTCDLVSDLNEVISKKNDELRVMKNQIRQLTLPVSVRILPFCVPVTNHLDKKLTQEMEKNDQITIKLTNIETLLKQQNSNTDTKTEIRKLETKIIVRTCQFKAHQLQFQVKMQELQDAKKEWKRKFKESQSRTKALEIQNKELQGQILKLKTRNRSTRLKVQPNILNKDRGTADSQNDGASHPKARLKCLQCEKTFTDRTNRSRHQSLHRPKSIRCSHKECEKVFDRKDVMRAHFARYHSNE